MFGYFGIRTKIAAGAALIAGAFSVYLSFQEMSRLGNSKRVSGIVSELNDRAPYQGRPDIFGLEFPIVEYVDEHGVTRKKPSGRGASQGYFQIGQEVVMAKSHRGYRAYEIADLWFIWQNTLAYLAFATLLTGIAVAYHLFMRSPEHNKRKKKRSNPESLDDAKPSS